MRIFMFVNNWVGWQVLPWLKEQDEEIVALVGHPSSRRRFGDEIVSTVDLDPSKIVDGSRLREPEIQGKINILNADMALSIYFGYILRLEFVRCFPKA